MNRTGKHRCVVCLDPVGWEEYDEYDHSHADCFYTGYPLQTTFEEADEDHEWSAK